jgi:predicted phage terminase large subunit-like protein
MKRLKRSSKNALQPLKAPELSRLQIEAEKMRRSLYEFVRGAWHILEPNTPFMDGIHVRAICEHLQAVSEGRIRNLIINVPPGHAKSLLTAVFWPAWVWINHPEARWLFSSHRVDLAVRDSGRCRRLIESPWYQERWGELYQLSGDQNEKNRFENTKTGYRVVVPMSAGTGERGDYVVVDDPHCVDQTESDLKRQQAAEWWDGSMATRLNDLITGHKVVIQQRLHEEDLTGHLLPTHNYELLVLPAEFDPDHRCSTSIGWKDPRQEAGELLWPNKVTADILKEMKLTLGSCRYAGQYQQRPAPADGGLFKRFWFRFWRPAHIFLPPVTSKTPNGNVISIEAVPIPAQFDIMIQSWDTSFKSNKTSDYVVGQVWGASRADRFLVDQVRGQMDMPSTKEAVKALSQQWPKSATKLIEDKANGPAVIQELQHDLPGLIAVNPEGGKVARANAVSPQFESGNVYLPHPAIAPWVQEFIEEVTAFPYSRNDDQVDAMTQALIRLRNNSGLSVPESQITVDPFPIPDKWPRAFGMAITRTEVGAVWGARDPGGKIYLYAEHHFSHPEPSQNAVAIKRLGEWIPGVVNTSRLKGSQAESSAIAEIFRDRGLNVEESVHGEEAGVLLVWQLMASNQLKVFASLGGFLTEYRIGDEKSLLMLCCQSLVVSGRDRMRTKPIPEQLPGPTSDYGRFGWMA